MLLIPQEGCRSSGICDKDICQFPLPPVANLQDGMGLHIAFLCLNASGT